MIFYVINLLFITILMYILREQSKIRKIIVFIWLFLIGALRASGIGNDYYSYQELYELFLQNDYRGYEIIYILLNLLCEHVGGYRSVVVLVSALSMIGPVYYIEKYSKQPILSMWLYITMSFFTWTFTIYRQAIAISFMLIAYSFAQEKKPIKFLSFLLLATGFHDLSILLIIVYPLLNIQWIKRIWLYLSTIIVICFVALRKYLIVLVNSVQNLLSERFLYYDLNDVKMDGETLLFVYFLVFLFVIICLCKRKQLFYRQILLLSSSFMVICQAIATAFPLANRMGLFFAVPTFLLFPNVLEDTWEKRSKRLGSFLVMLISLLYFIIVMYQEKHYGSSIVPYRFFWQGD